MDKEKFVGILSGAGKLYGKEIDKETMEMWLSFFKDNTTEEFRQAMNEHIKISRFFPTVADIKAKIYEIKNPNETNTELWERLLEAVRRSSYYYEEEFEKLPLLLKKYVGSPRQLQELAQEDSSIIHSVVKGQFLKQIELIKENYRENEITGKGNLLVDKGYIQLEEVIK
ncbi:MAG: hypothetical protein II625_06145 [Bacilli bacterium]|nr:hypothetical protein [Bacilli bacterium]